MNSVEKYSNYANIRMVPKGNGCDHVCRTELAQATGLHLSCVKAQMNLRVPCPADPCSICIRTQPFIVIESSRM